MKSKFESVAIIFLTAIFLFFFSQHWLIENIMKLLETRYYDRISVSLWLTPLGVIFMFFLIYANMGAIISFFRKESGGYLFESFIEGLIVGSMFGLFLGGILSFINGVQSFLFALNAGMSIIFIIFLFKGIGEELKI